ncbi:hypothetical protein FS837_006208 [Tulasnella sp. UAMH 9824]|nr:hypothetical protein FS837_006208 [Tulasnella sp. UAMH 9824]
MNGTPIPTDLPPELVPSSNIAWALSEDELQSYNKIFRAWDPRGTGFISGEAGLELFDQSGLSKYELGCIWHLADSTNRGSLNLSEFQVAMGLIFRAMNGARIPTVLPAELAPLSERDSGDSVNIHKDILSQDSHELTSNGSSLNQQDGKIHSWQGTLEGNTLGRSGEDAINIHDNSDTGVYKSSSWQLGRRAILYGEKSSVPDLNEIKRQSESASSQQDARIEVEDARNKKDEKLEDDLNDLKYCVKEVQEDLDQTTRGPRNVRKDEKLQRLERELLEIQDEIPG